MKQENERLKKCSACNKLKTVGEFGKHKQSKDGIRNICKACDRKRRRVYYQNHREKILQYQKKYYRKHKDQRIMYQRKYSNR